MIGHTVQPFKLLFYTKKMTFSCSANEIIIWDEFLAKIRTFSLPNELFSDFAIDF